MNKETILGIAFWVAILGGGLWVLGIFDGESTKTQFNQKPVPVYSTPTPTRTPLPPLKLPQTFREYPCTIDCSGHEAGYEWAEEHGITNPDDCGGKSQSFIEGCQSYAEENSDGNDSF